MKAIYRFKYGSPDVLTLAELDRPIVKDDEVLVHICASSIHAGDWHLMRGTPFLIRLIFGGLLKPQINILGTDIAGRVEKVGKNATSFKSGDEVFGDLSEDGFGAFAEYARMRENNLAPKPTNMTFEEAATAPTSAMAALQSIRDIGQLKPNQQVLIVVASGGVGSFAVQIAKAFGAEVSAVCHARKADMVRSLGADRVVDYTQTDITKSNCLYDLIVDAAAYRSVFDYKSILRADGTYVLVGGASIRFFQAMLLGPLLEKIMHRKIRVLSLKPNRNDLLTIKEMIESKQIVAAVDRCYPLEQVPEAIRYLENRNVQGKIAISVAQ